MNIKDKIIENLCNLLNENNKKEKLNELSMSKTDVYNALFSIRNKVNTHLIYCYLFSSSREYNHWKKEIASFIPQLTKLKGTNKYPNEKQLKRWVINDTIELIETKIENIIKNACQEENVDIPNWYNKDKVTNYMIEFWNWLAKYIADGKDINYNDIYYIIDELIKKNK